MSKTTDYATRLVISAPDLDAENVGDLMVDIDHCALPLASALVNFFPFVMYYLTAFFSKEFGGKLTYECYNKTTGEIISRVNDLLYIKNVISKIIITIFLDSILSLIVLIILFSIHKTMTFILKWQ